MPRKKEFDTQAVIEKAMFVFWENGYEHTSMQDLVDAMGIHRRSIYDTFGDKHKLFLLTLKHYESLIGQSVQVNLKEEMSIQEKLKAMFSVIVNEDNNRAGCLIVNTAAELSNIDPLVKEEVEALFERERQSLYQLLVKGQLHGEISAETDGEDLADYLHNALVGIRVLAKTTDDSKKLNRIIDTTLATIK